MRFSVLSTLAFATSSLAISILLGNDDGFASAQTRETKRLLEAEGHQVVLVAAADNESGQGGRSVFTNNRSLVNPSEFNLIPAGAASLGRDPTDPDVWYYNGTPAACAFVAIDYVFPTYYSNRSIDLVVAGPNFGTNLGPFLYTLSGTAGYTYSSVGRGYPAIAFSGGNGEQRSYQWINATTPSGYPDPATIQAQLAVDIVNSLVNSTRAGERILPLGYGVSVNTPFITSLTNDSCVAPPFIQSRLTGGADYDTAVFNATSGTFHYANIVSPGGNRCINGNCALPGETNVLDDGCQSSVSVFTVDYDAPTGPDQAGVRARLSSVVEYFANSTTNATHGHGGHGGYGPPGYGNGHHQSAHYA